MTDPERVCGYLDWSEEELAKESADLTHQIALLESEIARINKHRIAIHYVLKEKRECRSRQATQNHTERA